MSYLVNGSGPETPDMPSMLSLPVDGWGRFVDRMPIDGGYTICLHAAQYGMGFGNTMGLLRTH